MSDTNKYHNESIRGNEAKAILNNPLFIESFELVEKSFMKELTSTNYKDVETREELYRRIQVLNDVKNTLVKALTSGKVAEEKLSHLQRAKNIIGL
jgi:hypothetical protein